MRLAALPLLLLMAGCGGSPAQPAPIANAVTISGATTGLAPNMKVQLSASLKPGGAAAVDCTSTAVWSSSNDTIVKLTGATPGEFRIVDAGDVTVSAVCSNTTGTLSLHIDKPTSWPVSGRVTAGYGGEGIAGATLTFGNAPPVTTSADGRYTIVTTDASTQPLVISAPGYYTRETYLRAGELRSLDIDLIPPDLQPYWRAMAHNGNDRPDIVDRVGTHRWTRNPNIYIRTAWRDTGAPVNNVDWYVHQVRRVIPQLSGFTLQAGVIETGSEYRAPAPGWITLHFDHSGNWGTLGADPGAVQLGSDHTCNQIAVTHEFGHAMGYWHTGMADTIMGRTLGYCGDADFTPNELRVAKAMYARAPSNFLPDRASQGPALLVTRATAPVIVTCDHILPRVAPR